MNEHQMQGDELITTQGERIYISNGELSFFNASGELVLGRATRGLEEKLWGVLKQVLAAPSEAPAETTATRFTKEDLESRIKSVQYQTLIDTTTTICQITMVNGYQRIGYSHCSVLNNFDEESSKKSAYEHAFEKLWELEAYLLKEDLYRRDKDDLVFPDLNYKGSPSQEDNIIVLKSWVNYMVWWANKHDLVLTVGLVSNYPPTMGDYEMKADIRGARHPSKHGTGFNKQLSGQKNFISEDELPSFSRS